MQFLICLLFFGASYVQYSAAGFTATQERQLLDRHNELRSEIAQGKYNVKGVWKPHAANMLKLRWDSSLASEAQSYANTCPTGHSKNRIDTGENLYWYWSPVVLTNLTGYAYASSDSWSDEFVNFGWASNVMSDQLLSTGVVHATQMAWAKTSKLGCGMSLCDNGKTVAVVCQYRPMGNMITENIYEEGRTCSNCPEGTSCETSTGLCY